MSHFPADSMAEEEAAARRPGQPAQRTRWSGGTVHLAWPPGDDRPRRGLERLAFDQIREPGAIVDVR